MHRQPLIKLLIAVVVVASLVLSACQAAPAQPGPSKPSTTEPAAAKPAAQEKPASAKNEILVGAPNSMTGENALTGAEQKWAQEQAVADINAKGGVYVKELDKKLPIRLIHEDDKSTADGAAAAMEKLIKIHNVDLALSTNITPLNIAAATVAEKYKMFYLINTSWLDVIGEQRFKWAADMFFTAPSAAEVPFQVWDLQPKEQRPQRPAIMMEDNPDGQAFGKGFQEMAKKHNYPIALDLAYTPGTKDYSSLILKMKANNIDALLWLGSPPDGITMVRQMKQQQLDLKYLHGWKGFWSREFEKTLGKDAEYVIHDGFWADTLPYPGAKELGEKFRQSHNGQDSVSVGLPYAAVQVLAQAIEKAGSIDPAKVRDAVFGGEFKGTVMGDVKFDENGLCFTPSLALQWYGGQRMPVWPKTDYQLKWMPSWSQR